MNSHVKAEHKLVDLELLGVQMWSIPKKLHESGLILDHCTTTLSQGIELIELELNEFL
jgi:hypothetical protein